jgi:hypothetical protein
VSGCIESPCTQVPTHSGSIITACNTQLRALAGAGPGGGSGRGGGSGWWRRRQGGRHCRTESTWHIKWGQAPVDRRVLRGLGSGSGVQRTCAQPAATCAVRCASLLSTQVWRADEALSQQVAAADDEWCHCAMVGVRHDPASARSCVLQAVMIEPLCVGTCVHGDSMVGVRHDATAEVEPKEQPSARREFRVSTVFHPSAD